MTCGHFNTMRYNLHMLTVIERRRIKKVIYSKLTLVVLIVLLVLLARGTWGVYKKAKYAKGNESMATQELQVLRERESFLLAELGNLESGRGQEGELRKRFDVGREGEHLIVLVDSPAPEQEVMEKPEPLWQKIKNLF